MKNVKLFEEFFWNKKDRDTVSFYTYKSFGHMDGNEKPENRTIFNITGIDNHNNHEKYVITLENGGEVVEITTDGDIESHTKNGRRMKQTFLVDDITKKELREIKTT